MITAKAANTMTLNVNHHQKRAEVNHPGPLVNFFLNA
jgi:hypothetical protein